MCMYKFARSTANWFCSVCEVNTQAESHLKKLRAHSVATAFASRVLPVPGGPYSNTPENIEMSLLTCYLYRPGVIVQPLKQNSHIPKSMESNT